MVAKTRHLAEDARAKTAKIEADDKQKNIDYHVREVKRVHEIKVLIKKAKADLARSSRNVLYFVENIGQALSAGEFNPDTERLTEAMAVAAEQAQARLTAFGEKVGGQIEGLWQEPFEAPAAGFVGKALRKAGGAMDEGSQSVAEVASVVIPQVARAVHGELVGTSLSENAGYRQVPLQNVRPQLEAFAMSVREANRKLRPVEKTLGNVSKAPEVTLEALGRTGETMRILVASSVEGAEITMTPLVEAARQTARWSKEAKKLAVDYWCEATGRSADAFETDQKRINEFAKSDKNFAAFLDLIKERQLEPTPPPTPIPPTPQVAPAPTPASPVTQETAPQPQTATERAFTSLDQHLQARILNDLRNDPELTRAGVTISADKLVIITPTQDQVKQLEQAGIPPTEIAHAVFLQDKNTGRVFVSV